MKTDERSLYEMLRKMPLAMWIKTFGTVWSQEKAERIAFDLWPMQERLCNLLEKWQEQGFREFAGPKSRQVGISEIAGERHLKSAMSYPKNKSLIVSADQDRADEFLKARVLEKYLALPTNIGITWPKLIRSTREEIEFSNGSIIMSLPAKDTAGQSYSASDVTLDECGGIDLNNNATFYGVRRNIRPAIEKAGKRGWLMQIGTSEPGTQWNEFVKKIVQGKDQYTKMYFMNWRCDPNRDAGWYEREREMATDEVSFKTQYPDSIEDFFVVKGGLVVPQFNHKRHVQEFTPPTIGTRLYFGYDDGYAHPSVFLTCFYDHIKDHLYVWDEEYWVRKDVSEKAPMIKQIENSTIARFNLQTFRKIADSAIWQKRSSLSIADEFALQGVKFNKARKSGGLSSPDGSLEKMRRYFKSDKITIHPRCQNLINDFMSWKYKKGGKESVEDINDDGPDVIRYILEDVNQEPLEKAEAFEVQTGYNYHSGSIFEQKGADTDSWMGF